jgi:site-specific recombinase XerD
VPHPKFQVYKDASKRYRVEVPKSLSSERPRRRRRRFFSTLEQAEKFLRVFKAQLRDMGTSAQILKPVDAIDANEAIQALKRHAIKHGLRRPKLRDIADGWIDRWNEQHRSVSVAKLFDEYLETRGQDSQKHQQSLRYTKERLQRLHTRKVSTLTKEDIEDALWKLPPASFNAHLRRVRSVLNYGIKHGYLTKNPALLVESIKRPRQSVKILPVETVELMLRTAQESVPEVLPFLCVSLFTGARPEEISKLLWSDFNLADKILRIRPEVSKTNRHRNIDLSDNAIAWLETFKRQAGRRVMAGFTRAILSASRAKLWELMRKAQPELPKHAPHNALRHCYVSHYLCNHGTIDALLLQSGHTRGVMFDHYLNIVSRADAENYWSLKP